MTFYYHTQEFPLEKKSKFSVGYDLHAMGDYDLEYGRPVIISTGIRLVLPWQQCREAQIRVRSSVGMNGIIVCNSPGTIDVDYCGEVKVILCNISTEGQHYHIHQGDRIAQLIVVPQPFVYGEPGIEPVYDGPILVKDERRFQDLYNDIYGAEARGIGGLGSTGR